MKTYYRILIVVLLISILHSGLLCICPTETICQDNEKIRLKALDYMEGWFEGNAERMKSCLHPDLAKRGLFYVKQTGRNRLGLHTATTLVEGTRLGKGKRYPIEKRNIKIDILDQTKNIASVKVTCLLTTEYLHLVKYNGEWSVLNVLFEMES